MHIKFLKLALLLCLSTAFAYGQKNKDKKPGMLAFSVNYSDYGFFKAVNDSSISYALNRKGLFKSGNSSFGFGVSYWKGLGSHFDFSGDFAGTFSNFPKLFVKGDSVGRAAFTPQLDLLLHAKAFKEHRLINPFITAGIGAGYFRNQLALYAPLGVGLQFHFKSGTYVFVQAQWKMALNDGIRDDFMFYSLGIGQHKKAKKQETKAEIPATDTVAKQKPKDSLATKPKVNLEKDTDGDGVPDYLDLCVTVKGTVNGCPDADGDGVPDKDDKCKDVKGVARYNGCPVPDTDADGVNDDDDQCPSIAGVKENNGCPADRDGDGIYDKDDKCPDAAGTAENNGCPMKIIDGGKLIKSATDAMTYYIRFDFDKADITMDAFKVLREIVNTLKADKTLKISIEGHADNFGLEKYNMLVSSDRANVARDYFLSYGIARSRMKTSFYGSSKPYDIHQDWLNRRVEITILK
jgi:outer membrane protein OmpA-like peptidoglycan-associated protein